MRFVGIIVPYLIEVRVLDTTSSTIEHYVCAKHFEIDEVRGIEAVTTDFAETLNMVREKLDGIVIVSAAQTRMNLVSIYKLAQSYVPHVHIIPPRMAMFLATIEKHPVDQIQSFSIVTNALGYELHTFKRVAEKENTFVCRDEQFYSPDKNVNLDLCKVDGRAVDLVIHVTLGKGQGPKPFTSTTSYKNVSFEDFRIMLLKGAVVKAKILSGAWNRNVIEDFAETMMIHSGNQLQRLCKTGEPLPFRYTGNSESFKVVNGIQLNFEKGQLNRKLDILYVSKPTNSSFEVTANVNKYGFTKIKAKKHEKEALESVVKPVAVAKSSSEAGSETTETSLTKGKPGIKMDAASFEVNANPKAEKQASTPVIPKIPLEMENSKVPMPRVLLGHVLLSASLFIQDANGHRREIHCPDVREFGPGFVVSEGTVSKHCCAVFAHIPESIIGTIGTAILVHDGRVPSTGINMAIQILQSYVNLKSEKILVVPTMAAYLQGVLQHFNFVDIPLPNQRIFCAFIQEKFCRYFFIEYASNGWGIRKTKRVVVKSPTDIVNSLMQVDEFPQTTHRLLFAEVCPLSLQQAAAKSNFKLIRLDFSKIVPKGILDIGDVINDQYVPASKRVHGFCLEITYKQVSPGGHQQSLVADTLIPMYQEPFFHKETCRVRIRTGKADMFQIVQDLSMFTTRKFVLYEAADIPELPDLTIQISLSAFGLPVFDLDQQYRPTQWIAPSLPAKPLNPIKTLPDVESVEQGDVEVTLPKTEKPKSEAKVLVKFDIPSITARIFINRNDKNELVPGPNGETSLPMFISVATDTIKIGYSAMLDYRKHPNSVVFDILKIIGLKASDIKAKRKWKFGIAPASETDDTAVIIAKHNGKETLFNPHHVFGFFLGGVTRLVEDNMGTRPTHMTFELPSAITANAKIAITTACEFAGIVPSFS